MKQTDNSQVNEQIHLPLTGCVTGVRMERDKGIREGLRMEQDRPPH